MKQIINFYVVLFILSPGFLYAVPHTQELPLNESLYTPPHTQKLPFYYPHSSLFYNDQLDNVYVQADGGDDFWRDRNKRRLLKEKAEERLKAQEKAARLQEEAAEEEAARLQEEAERQEKKRNRHRMKPKPLPSEVDDSSIQLRSFDIGNRDALENLVRYLNQEITSDGRLRPRRWFADMNNNLLTETMDKYNERAKKYGGQPLPPGFLAFKTTPTSFRLLMGENGYALLDSNIAAAGFLNDPRSRFGDIGRLFQPERVPSGKEVIPRPNRGDLGIYNTPSQPWVVGGESQVSETGWTVLLPAELLLPKLKHWGRNTTTHARITGSKISPSNPYPDIGFVMRFPKKGLKHTYTIIYSDLPVPDMNEKMNLERSTMGFYVAPIIRFEKEGKELFMQGPHELVSLEVFLETLQKDGIVKLWYGRDGKISRVKWLIEP